MKLMLFESARFSDESIASAKDKAVLKHEVSPHALFCKRDIDERRHSLKIVQIHISI
jgi:hypothetical protein